MRRSSFPSTSSLLLRVASAAWGFAVAVALLPHWTRPAQPGQLPGFATSLGLDATAPMHFVAGLMLLPIVASFALLPVVRALACISHQCHPEPRRRRGISLRRSGVPLIGRGFLALLGMTPGRAVAAPCEKCGLEGARRWAQIGAAASMVTALWIALIEPSVAWTIVAPAAGVAVCLALRNFDARFTRRDVILVPATLAVYLAQVDLAQSLSFDRQFLIAVALVLGLRIALAFVPSPAAPAYSFLLSPLALAFQTFFFSPAQRHLGWPSLVIALGTPLLLRFVLTNERRAAAIVAFAIYPIASYSYMASTNAIVADGKPRVNLFEDAHGVVPAGEMLQGELPYRDIIPAHGFVEDGLLDYVSMRMRGATLGNALKSRLTFGMLNGIGVYALAAAATGSAEAGFLGFLLAALLGTIPTTSRVVPQLFTLAVIAAAVRRRQPKLFAAAGFGAVLSLLTSLDFGLYTTLTLLVALLRFRPNPLRAVRDAAIGAACAAVPLFAIFGALGIARSFVTTTLFEVLTLGPVSTMEPFSAPAAFKTYRFFPEVLVAFFDRGATMYVVWACAAIFTAVAIVMRARRRTEPLLLVAFWIVAGGMSYAARHHLHFQFVVAPLLAAAVWTLGRLRIRFAAVAFVALLAIGQLTIHLVIDGMVRNARGPLDANVTTIDDLPRARGAWFTKEDARTVETAKHFVDRSLGPVETFVDFTNRPMLYFLLDRDCPIRQLGPSWYEPEERQRAVIAQIDRNPHVRGALVPNGLNDGTGLDNVANQLRAPLVWHYLQTHFEPQYEENGMVWWHRR